MKITISSRAWMTGFAAIAAVSVGACERGDQLPNKNRDVPPQVSPESSAARGGGPTEPREDENKVQIPGVEPGGGYGEGTGGTFGHPGGSPPTTDAGRETTDEPQ